MINLELLKDSVKDIGEGFELYTLHKNYLSIEFENNKLKGISKEDNSGVALKLIVNGKIGFSTTTKQDDINGLIERAKKASEFGKKIDYSLPSQSLSHESDSDETPTDIDYMVSIGEDIISEIFASDPEILGFATITRCKAHVMLSNFNKTEGSYYKTLYYISAGGKFTEEGNILYVYDSISSPTSFLGTSNLKGYLKESFSIAKKNISLSSARYNIILSPSAVTDLLVPITVCSNGKNIEKGVSPWVNKIGETIFDPRINIIDDSKAEDGIASCPFDDEGVTPTKTKIIDKGILCGYYHSLSTAFSTRSEPTGNGFKGGSNIMRKNINAVPEPSPTNIIMTGGDMEIEDIFREVKDGILIEQLLGTFTSNHLAGQVNGNISLGYKISNGKKIGRIKNATFSVNIFDILKNNLIGLSKELTWKGDMLLPYILLSNINITC